MLLLSSALLLGVARLAAVSAYIVNPGAAYAPAATVIPRVATPVYNGTVPAGFYEEKSFLDLEKRATTKPPTQIVAPISVQGSKGVFAHFMVIFHAHSI
jgi:hypothetical protein